LDLIVGLGNPGSEYTTTRHNIGFTVINLWALKLGADLTRRRFKSKISMTRLNSKNIILLCPLTFMNLSGRSVRGCIDYYRLTANNVLVVHDDIDLPVGKIKVVRGGGAGGHKGVDSIIQNLGTKDFARIKVGIGRPLNRQAVEKYVLAPFYKSERVIIDKVVLMSIHGCELFVLNGVEKAMNTINCQNLLTKEENK
jgi:PTH1 family peptidyl-tRNA hydrolase